MRIATVEKQPIGFVCGSTPTWRIACHFSARSARDEIRRVIGRSEPDVTIGSDRDQNRGCRKKDKDHTEFLCQLYEAQAACGRNFVHELASAVNSRVPCVAKNHDHARNENDSGRPVHVRAGRMR